MELGYLAVTFIAGFGSGFLVREVISRRRRLRERRRRYSLSEMDRVSVRRRLEPLAENEVPPSGGSA